MDGTATISDQYYHNHLRDSAVHIGVAKRFRLRQSVGEQVERLSHGNRVW